MKNYKTIVIAGAATVVAASTLACLYVHRRVIKAVIKGEPIPKAPAWHCWVKNRVGNEEAEEVVETVGTEVEEAPEAEEAETAEVEAATQTVEPEAETAEEPEPASEEAPEAAEDPEAE